MTLVTRQVIEDTYIGNAEELNVVHGNREYTRVVKTSQKVCWAYFKFDISGITVASSCKLKLHLLNFNVPGDRIIVRVCETDSNWSESTFTYAMAMNSPYPGAIYNIAITPTFYKYPVSNILEIDVISHIATAIKGGRTTLSIALDFRDNQSSDQIYMEFGTKEGGQGAYLEIEDAPFYPMRLVAVDEDTYYTNITTEARNMNFSTEDTVDIMYTNPGQVRTFTGYLVFRYTNNDVHAPIDRAYLNFWIMPESTYTPGYKIWISGRYTNLDESNVTYNTIALYPLSFINAFAFILPTAPLTEPLLVEVDVTRFIHWNSCYEGITFIITPDNTKPDEWVIIGSKEGGRSSYLSITYSWILPSPQTLLDVGRAVVPVSADSFLYRTGSSSFGNQNRLPHISVIGVNMSKSTIFLKFDVSKLTPIVLQRLSKAILKVAQTKGTVSRTVELYVINSYCIGGSEWTEDNLIGGTCVWSSGSDIPCLRKDEDGYPLFYLSTYFPPTDQPRYHEIDVRSIIISAANEIFSASNGILTLYLESDYPTQSPITFEYAAFGSKDGGSPPILELEWDIDYYVDGVLGDDSNDGLTTVTPWKTIDHSSKTIVPFSTLNIQNDFSEEPVTNQIAPTSMPVRYRHWTTAESTIEIN